jgi:hypothetical protein
MSVCSLRPERSASASSATSAGGVYFISNDYFVNHRADRDCAISPIMKGTTCLYSGGLHEMGWAAFQKIEKCPRWEKATGFSPILRAINLNQPQFSHFSGLQWEVFHHRLVAQSPTHHRADGCCQSDPKLFTKTTKFIHTGYTKKGVQSPRM